MAQDTSEQQEERVKCKCGNVEVPEGAKGKDDLVIVSTDRIAIDVDTSTGVCV
jgi:hypothetical protein